MMQLLGIGTLGLVGVFFRYGIDRIMTQFSFPFPVATFLINLLGSFLAGLVYGLGAERAVISPELRTGLLVGFCGGFTTFSAAMLQSFLLFDQRKIWMSALYLLMSPVIGVFFAMAGVYLARSGASTIQFH